MAHIKKMLVEDWIAVDANPIQRDTERHAAKAKHLRVFHPTHSVVSAAELPSGKLIKLDGHTRALMWRRKEIPAPTQVTVVCYQVKDKAEAEQSLQRLRFARSPGNHSGQGFGRLQQTQFRPPVGPLEVRQYRQRASTGLWRPDWRHREDLYCWRCCGAWR